jgi:hypothetical protein
MQPTKPGSWLSRRDVLVGSAAGFVGMLAAASLRGLPQARPSDAGSSSASGAAASGASVAAASLATLTIEDFAGLVGSGFEATVGADRAVLVLRNAVVPERLDSQPRPEGLRPEGFQLLFALGEGSLPVSGIAEIEHSAIGSQLLFLHRVGLPTTAPAHYEIIFN